MASKAAVGVRVDSKNEVGLEGTCAVCHVKTVLRCHGCIKGGKERNEIPFYCGKKHQTSHWKSEHKANCGSNQGWKVGKNCNPPYYVAVKKLKPGHVLFTKKPLLVFPKIAGPEEIAGWCQSFPHMSDEIRSSDKRLLWTCISCYELMLYGQLVQDPVNGLRLNKCTECGWPVHCNIIPGQPPSDCQVLHADECLLLRFKKSKWETLVDSEDHFLYYYLGVLRAVLLPPKLKKELSSLPVFLPKLYPCIWNSDKMIDFVRQRANLAECISESELKQLIMIIFSNCLGLSSYSHTFRKKHGFIIFEGCGSTGRILPHDCCANSDFHLNIETLEGTFKTTREVAKGETLSMNYFMPNIHLPVHERIVYCAVQLFMPTCECLRCRSSTENDTFLSAIRCPGKEMCNPEENENCQYAVPVPQSKEGNPGNDLFVWQCMCNSCGGVIKQSDVTQLIDLIMDDINKAASVNDYDELKSIVKRCSGEIVHPKNSAMVYAYLKIAAVAFNRVKTLNQYRTDGFKFDLHKKYLGDFEKILEIYQELQPGRNGNTGIFMFCHALLNMSELSEKLSDPETTPSQKDLIEQLEAIMGHLEESWIIAKENPFMESTDKCEELTLQKLYANHLAQSMKKVGDFAQLPAVTLFCEKYADEEVMSFWQKWESNPLNWVIFPESELPKLLRL